jgi:hypothetical protein
VPEVPELPEVLLRVEFPAVAFTPEVPEVPEDPEVLDKAL